MNKKQIEEELNLNLEHQNPIHSKSDFFRLVSFLYGGTFEEIWKELQED